MKITNITVYTKANCPLCVQAKNLLNAKGMEYDEKSMDSGNTWLDFAMAYPQIKQMPAIFINRQYVGGFAGLQAALKQLGL